MSQIVEYVRSSSPARSTLARWRRACIAIAALLGSGAVSATTRVVTSLADFGTGTLREVISNVDPGDTVEFAPGLTGTITVSSPLFVNRAVTIDGGNRITLDGNDTSRVIQVSASGLLHLRGTTVQRGFAPQGGGIINFGVLIVERCVLRDNHATDVGGAIGNYGSSMSVLDAEITENDSNGGGGGIFDQPSGESTIARSRVTGNIAGASGGGIWLNSGRTMTITNSTISGNQIAAPGASTGGGIAVQSSTLNMRHSTVSGNKAQFGGGVYVVAATAAAPSTANIDNSLIAGNTGVSDGGGMFVFGSTMNMTNSTVAFNTTGISSAGGIGIQNTAQSTSNARLVNTTVAFNRATGVAGGINLITGNLRLRNSLVSNNVGTSNSDLSGTFVSEGFNLVATRGSSAGYIASDLPNGSAASLGTLVFNGGATNTLALNSGSAAINAVPQANCVDAGILVDQRGYQRPVTGGCDIGAFEVEGTLALEGVFADDFE